jgi:hypothetical protein
MLALSKKAVRALKEQRAWRSKNDFVRREIVMTLNNPRMVWRYYSTDIITIYPERIEIETDGWGTYSTLRRINDFLRSENIPLEVHAHRGSTIVEDRNRSSVLIQGRKLVVKKVAPSEWCIVASR